MVLRFFLLAVVFFFASCHTVERDNPLDPDGVNYRGSSSSGITVQSSSSKSVAPPSSSSAAAEQSSSSVAKSSSSAAVPSSSSAAVVAPSSSSAAVFSSSSKPSSSSVALSSSSVPPQSGIIYGPTVSYGDEEYQSVTIGTQTWLAKNLNYNVDGSKCYGDSESNCTTYGRLYNWAAAMEVCPSGWHLPSDAEWTALTDYVGDSSTAGTKLKSASGWNSGGIAGTDDYGFAALPGGYGLSGGDFYDVRYDGYWWSASEFSSVSAYYMGMYYSSKNVGYNYDIKSNLFSVRCVQD